MSRPRTPLLSRELIRMTCLAIVDEDGLGNLSMRKIAARLNVQAPSLYSHYATKDELLDDLASGIMEAVDVSAFAFGDWRYGLKAWAQSYRAALASHPNFVPLLAYGPSQRPVSLERANAVHGGLIRAGWSPRTATMIGAATKYLVVGAAIGSFSSGFIDDVAVYDDRYPNLMQAHLLREHAEEIDVASFELALDSFIDGLEVRFGRVGVADCL